MSFQANVETAPQDLGVRQDWELIQKCLSGSSDAWTQLYHSAHDRLLAAIRSSLRDVGDANLVEEIAARVWYALVRNEGALLEQFDMSRGCRLSTYLSLLAKSEARQYFRSERRRRTREERASRPELSTESLESLLQDEEFLDSLSKSEKDYLQNVLLAVAADSKADRYSPQNTWQLSHRVRKKLTKYLEY
jgi:DNA-directed RNA polymerase specialized sigma24 family protein